MSECDGKVSIMKRPWSSGGCYVIERNKAYITCYIYYIYRLSQEEWTELRESVPYVELYRYNPKHLYPNLNGYGDNDQRI